MQCRVCMQNGCRILLDMSVACTGDGKSLFDYFNECTQLNASANDGFPKTVCKMCAQKLQIAYNFRKCARNSHDDFQKQLISQKIETESVLISTHASFALMDREDTTEDPLNMKFNEAVKALTKSDLEHHDGDTFPKREPNEAVNVLRNRDLEYLDEDTFPKRELNVDVKENLDLDNELYEISSCVQPQAVKVKEEIELHIEETEQMERLGYLCEFCDTIYETKHELMKHVSVEHNSEVICKSCSKSFDKPVELRIHKKLVHENNSPVQCDYCKDTPLIDRNELEEHFHYKHKAHYFKYFPPTSYKCSYCRNMYSSAIELEDHLKTHDIFNCTFCNKSYGNFRSYKTHISRKHNINLKEAKDKSEKQSEDIHSVDSFVCYIRKETKGKRDRAVKNNLRKKRQITKTVRERCADKTTGSSKPKEMSRYLCSYCPRVLNSKSSMVKHERKQHLNIPTELKQCPHCPKKYGRQYLKRHIEIVHIGVRKFICDICGDAYKAQDTLNRHKQLHNKERNFPCSACDKSFPYKSELNVHMRLHTGEMPFDCHLCDRRFRIRVHLTYHLQKHANLLLKCKLCDKEFRNAKSLRMHAFEHSGIKPYNCPICDYGSVKRDYFKTHMLRKHDTTMTVDELHAMFKENTGRSPRVKLAEELGILNDPVHQEDILA